jgi:hypothetical protein
MVVRLRTGLKRLDLHLLPEPVHYAATVAGVCPELRGVARASDVPELGAREA